MDYLGKDQRKTKKDDKEDEKEIKGKDTLRIFFRPFNFLKF